MTTLAEQVLKLLPTETIPKWYSGSSYYENRKPKAAKRVLAEKYNSSRSEAKNKLKRSIGKRSIIVTRRSSNSSSNIFNIILQKSIKNFL